MTFKERFILLRLLHIRNNGTLLKDNEQLIFFKELQY